MCPLYGVVGCPLFTGYLSIEVNGRTVGNVSLVVMYVVIHTSFVLGILGTSILH